MKPQRLVLPLILFVVATIITTVHLRHVAADDARPATSAAPDPRAKNGKKLLTAMDLMKVSNVGAPRITPDGTRVAGGGYDGTVQVWNVADGKSVFQFKASPGLK